jgi:hypothetical protein
VRRELRQEALWWLGALAAAFVGVGLRWLNLRNQVLTGDELHTVNGALARSAGEILRTWTWYGADYSVPLTAFFRVLLDRGVVLDELSFRAPVLIASALTPVVLAAAWRRHLGAPAALLLAWLLALSPMLALYGRIVRSYALVVLGANLAVLAFERFWRGGSRVAGAAYVALAALSTWLHLGAAPFVLAPFGFVALEVLRDRARLAVHLRRAAALACATALAVALPLIPAWSSLLELRDLHGAGAAPRFSAWLEVVRLQIGTRSGLVAALVAAAAARGALELARRDRDLALFAALLAVGQIAGLLVLAPNFLQAVIVVNRYVLVLLPLLLALVALGLATPVARAQARGASAAQAGAVVALLAALFAGGPLADAEYRWTSFAHAQPFLNFLHPGNSVPLDRVPRFYRDLPPGDEPILEAPWTNVGTHSFNAYQRVHRRPLRVGSIDAIHADPRLALRNTVPARPERLRASGARFVVVHLDVRREERHVVTTELRHQERLDALPELWQVLRVAGAGLAARLEREWGPPVYSDESIRVWDLWPASPASSRR